MDHDHAFDFEHPSLPYHEKPGTFYDDSDSIIRVDDVPSNLPVEMGPDTLRGSESCEDPNTLFMPLHDPWDDHMHHDEEPHQSPLDHHGAAFPHSRPVLMRGVSCGEQQFTWHCDDPPVLRRSESMYDYFPTDYHSDGSQVVSPTHESFGPGHPYTVPTCNDSRPHPVLTPPPEGAVPLSPPLSYWTSNAAGDIDAEPIQKRTRSAHAHRPHAAIQRGGCIRKRNAKFEIPIDRNLETLECLIKNAPDEHSLKEYKMQKRLLRNREAALHSRQKKKEHTLKLEGEQKQLQNHISALEDQVRVLKLKEEEHERERQEWKRCQDDAVKLVSQLETEKETLVKSFTKEATELRNDIAMLQASATNQSSPTSTVPSTVGYSDYHGDVHTAGLDNSDWHDFDLVSDFCITLDPSAPKKSYCARSRAEKTAASELLLTLVLLGAYVAANPSALPVQMPHDIGKASYTVLDRFFADAGVAPPKAITDLQPTPSGKSAVLRSQTTPRPISYKQCTDLGAALDSLRSDSQVYSLASLYSGSILTRNARADVVNIFKSLVTTSCSNDTVQVDPDPISNH